MRLNPKQWRHTRCTAVLLLHMIEAGYHPRMAYAKRSKEEATRLGFSDSNHIRYLAVDIDLFDSNGNFLSDTQSHRRFGEFWKTLDSDAVWGGDFPHKPDGNHYSFEHEGVK